MKKKKNLFIVFMLLFSFSLFAQTIDLKINEIKENEKSLIVSFSVVVPTNYYQQYSPDFFNVEIIDNEYLKLKEIIYPADLIEKKKVTGEIKLVSTFDFIKNIDKGETIPLKFNVNYQLCNKDGMCYRPSNQVIESDYTVEDGFKTSKISTLLFFIMFAFIGGVLLNIMPCVLPVLSIKAFSLVKQSNLTKKEIFLNSLVYSAGVIISLLLLALVASIIKLMGSQVGWGFQFQNPGFVMFLILVLYIFAFSMFDFVVFSFNGISASKTSNKYLESFSTGILAVLVATPCTAPFLGSALGFSFSQPIYVIFIIFFFIGLGLSLPFLLLGIFPAIIKALPKPGMWMNYFKELMGFLLFATVLWLLTVLYYQIGFSNLVSFLFYLLVIAFCLWIYRSWGSLGQSKKVRVIAKIVILVIAISSAFFLIKTKNEENVNSGLSISYAQQFDENSALASINNGEKVFIIFSAKWCMTCKTNEATVFSQNDIKDFFEKNSIKVYYGDWTNKDATIGEWIKKYDKAGVPLYVYFDGTGNYKVLPEILNKSSIFDLISAE